MRYENYKKGRTEVEGRTFQIEFWNESYFGLPWVKISEVTTAERKPHWFSNKTELREIKKLIDEGWTNKNRLDWAMERIAKYIQKEQDSIEEFRQIEAFCNMKN